MVQLGLGCIEIGRLWGAIQTNVPNNQQVSSLLDQALALDIKFFDTAPSYGFSEERLGQWLKGLDSHQRSKLQIATKFGEFWDLQTNQPYRKYDFLSLKKSINRSQNFLGQIDILQLHGANNDNLKDKQVELAIDYARSLGIKLFGASISDPLALKTAIDIKHFTFIQLPHNLLKPNDIDLIKYAQAKGKTVIINRPFAMGTLVQTGQFEDKVKAFGFILENITQGIILTGTKSATHLQENVEAFQRAKMMF